MNLARLLLVLIAGLIVAVPIQSADSLGWPLFEVRQAVFSMHALKPASSEIPVEREEFVKWLESVDPHAEITASEESSGSIGVLKIEADDMLLVVPLANGPAWNSGLKFAIEILDEDLLLNKNIIVGIDLRSERYVRRSLTPEKLTHGRVELSLLGVLQAMRVTGFVEGETKSSAQSVLRSSSLYKRRSFQSFSNLDKPGVKSRGIEVNPIILDLRYCVGGDIFEATDFGGLWLEDTRHWVDIIDVGNPLISLSTGGKYLPAGELAAVVVSRYTASACEQLVEGLRAYTVAKVYGENTYGKCSTQTTKQLTSGHSLRITTGYWSGPQGARCKTSGIKPDFFFEGNIHDDDAVGHWLMSNLNELRGLTPQADH